MSLVASTGLKASGRGEAASLGKNGRSADKCPVCLGFMECLDEENSDGDVTRLFAQSEGNDPLDKRASCASEGGRSEGNGGRGLHSVLLRSKQQAGHEDVSGFRLHLRVPPELLLRDLAARVFLDSPEALATEALPRGSGGVASADGSGGGCGRAPTDATLTLARAGAAGPAGTKVGEEGDCSAAGAVRPTAAAAPPPLVGPGGCGGGGLPVGTVDLKEALRLRLAARLPRALGGLPRLQNSGYDAAASGGGPSAPATPADVAGLDLFLEPLKSAVELPRRLPRRRTPLKEEASGAGVTVPATRTAAPDGGACSSDAGAGAADPPPPGPTTSTPQPSSATSGTSSSSSSSSSASGGQLGSEVGSESLDPNAFDPALALAQLLGLNTADADSRGDSRGGSWGDNNRAKKKRKQWWRGGSAKGSAAEGDLPSHAAGTSESASELSSPPQSVPEAGEMLKACQGLLRSKRSLQAGRGSKSSSSSGGGRGGEEEEDLRAADTRAKLARWFKQLSFLEGSEDAPPPLSPRPPPRQGGEEEEEEEEQWWHCSWTRAPLLLGGRYRKLSRDVPQSMWVIQGEGRKGRGSVEEVVAEDVAAAFRVKPCAPNSGALAADGLSYVPPPKKNKQQGGGGWHHTQERSPQQKEEGGGGGEGGEQETATGGAEGELTGGIKFHAAGREDMDVLMLGRGRPFILEVVDAKTLAPLRLVQTTPPTTTTTTSSSSSSSSSSAFSSSSELTTLSKLPSPPPQSHLGGGGGGGDPSAVLGCEGGQPLSVRFDTGPSSSSSGVGGSRSSGVGGFESGRSASGGHCPHSPPPELVTPALALFATLPQLQATVNALSGLNARGDVQVEALQHVRRHVYDEIIAGAEEKRKTYGCVVWVSSAQVDSSLLLEALESVRDLKVLQDTPIRVLHRRTPLVREKTIHALAPTFIKPHWFALEVEASAGTYIKEFVHGDLGRTAPSVGDLLRAALRRRRRQCRAGSGAAAAAAAADGVAGAGAASAAADEEEDGKPGTPPSIKRPRTSTDASLPGDGCGAVVRGDTTLKGASAKDEDEAEAEALRVDILQLDVKAVHTTGLLA